MARRIGYCLGLALLLIFLMARGTTAYAHAALIQSSPADGAILPAFPAQAVLTFDEPVSPLLFHLVAPDGTTQVLDHVQAVDHALRIDLPAQGLKGTYALSWRVISADGHPVGAALVFSLGAPSAAPAGADETPPFLRQPAIWLARLALYLGLCLGAGGALFLGWMPRAAHDGAIRCARLALLLGLVAVPASLALQGLDALNAPWSAVLGMEIWRTALGTTYSITLLLALLAMAAAWVALAKPNAVRRRTAAAASALLLGGAFAASGHASVAPPQWLARPAVWLHAVAVAAWLGSLIPLLCLARDDDAQFAPALRRFSRHIRWVVAVLLASGLLLAWLQIDHWASLWQTAYGQVLLCKLALAAALLLLAAWNRYRLTAGALAGKVAARAALARMIRMEIALVLCVLAVVALWRFTPPPRALDAGMSMAGMSMDMPMPASTLVRGASVSANLLFAQAGPNRSGALTLTLAGADSAPLHAVAVTVHFLAASGGMEPLSREARQLAPGRWEVSPLSLPQAVHWTVRMDIFVSDFDRIQLEGKLNTAAADMAGHGHRQEQ